MVLILMKYVHEVQLPEIPKQRAFAKEHTSSALNMAAEDGEWTALQEGLPAETNTASPDATRYSTLSEEISRVSSSV